MILKSLVSFSIAVILALPQMVFAADENKVVLSARYTAASLSRAEYDSIVAKFRTNPADWTLRAFNDAYNLDDVIVDVQQHLEGVGLSVGWFREYVTTWIVSLVLAKQGFEPVAQEIFFSGMIKMAVECNRLIVANAAKREDLEKSLSNVATWTIAATLNKFGTLRAYERLRLDGRIADSLRTFTSRKFALGIADKIHAKYTEPAARPAVIFAGAVGLVGGYLVILYSGVENIQSLSIRLPAGALTFLASAGGLFYGTLIPISYWIRRKVRRDIKVSAFPEIARSCQAFLNGEGEILPP